MPSSGDLLGERYRLVEPLAAGGMGTVWRAHHTELDADVAVKVMSASPLAGEKRFRREAQASARLRSPHIVQVLDYGMHRGQPYLVMELLEGEDLEARLASEGTLAVEQCATIIDAVAKALDLAHAHGIIHRDLKPSNIFLARVGGEEIAKVLDFGVAKDLRTGDKTTGAEVIGSPPYMSPEQVWGEPLTPKSDLWSLGVVAFEMLTGTNPFADDALAKVFDHIIRDDLPRLADLQPDLSPRFDAFFERAFARDAEDRFPSAQALADSFRAACGPNERNDALAPTVAIDAPRSRPSTWARTALVIGGALTLIAIVLLSTNRESPEATAEPSASIREPLPPAVAPKPPPAITSAAPSATAAKKDPPTRPRVRPPSSVDPLFGIPVESR